MCAFATCCQNFPASASSSSPTHIVSDVEATATDIALISNGTLVAHATPEELLRQVEGKVWEAVVPSTELQAIKQQYLMSGAARRTDGVHVRILAPSAPSGAQPLAPNPRGCIFVLS